ncbi:unnamed protein product [Diabrotica balteata]|uniref:Reverse transcriptase domain-containing protein n=1 Tax=Diabrotica balteata TaxID=107213 RepID=A0A9N9SX95_DIABA|nr:unnamed protein product [Diabrotica balteata]
MKRKTQNSIKPFSNEVLEDFFNKVSRPWVQYFSNQSEQSHQSNHFLLKPFTKSELDFALKNCNNTSPGLDQIKYPMLINLPRDAKDLLLQVFNDIIQNNIVIDSFKNAIVVPIIKSGKDPNVANSYKPISLLSCVFKTLERLIKLKT